jgi:hypothetical protein
MRMFLPDTDAKIELVFEYIDNTHYLEVLDVHRRFKRIFLLPDIKERFGREPSRGDDKRVLPLQAADLWVGLMRRAYEGDKNAAISVKKFEIPSKCFVYDEPTLMAYWNNSKQKIPDLA